ncbi:MAG TPA: hypothetical protein VN618_14910 [Solirubrobacteraceae bacterium]|nr:hypothetical protein [Solirubrobacteraceae bacterium]
MKRKRHDLRRHRRGRLLTSLVGACALLAAAAIPAGAAEKLNKADFARFINCPIEVAKGCTYGETLSGEFKMGTKQVPITTPVVLQGGLAYLGTETLPLIPPRFGAEAMSKSSQSIPGGLTGLTEIIGGPVNATAEIAGSPSDVLITAVFLGFGHDTAVQLPVKVHLENPILGENCYIGSDANPIVLHLTDGTTKPPAGTEPISGKIGKNEGRDHGRLLTFIENTLVDNAFPVPAATGCGSGLLEPVITAAVNLDAGLPSAEGKNVAILNGNFYTALSTWVAKYDKKLLKEKEHPKK